MKEQNKDLPQALITGGGGELAQSITKKLKSQGFEVLCPNKSHLDVTNKEYRLAGKLEAENLTRRWD